MDCLLQVLLGQGCVVANLVQPCPLPVKQGQVLRTYGGPALLGD